MDFMLLVRWLVVLLGFSPFVWSGHYARTFQCEFTLVGCLTTWALCLVSLHHGLDFGVCSFKVLTACYSRVSYTKCYCIFSILLVAMLIRSCCKIERRCLRGASWSRPLDSVLGSDVCPSKVMVVFLSVTFNVSSQCIVFGIPRCSHVMDQLCQYYAGEKHLLSRNRVLMTSPFLHVSFVYFWCNVMSQTWSILVCTGSGLLVGAGVSWPCREVFSHAGLTRSLRLSYWVLWVNMHLDLC